jgi:hypothetical protein
MKLKTFLLLISLLCVSLQKTDASYYYPVNGILYQTLTDSTVEVEQQSPKYTGDITIPESVSFYGKSYKVVAIGEYAFHWCTGLTSIKLPATLVEIKIYAFADCTNLTSIVIPDNVKKIDGSAFGWCSSLTTVTLGKSVTDIISSFIDCTALKSISLPNSLTNIGVVTFLGDTCLTSVSMGDNIKRIGSEAFEGCKHLNDIKFSSSLDSLGYRVFDGTQWLSNQPDGMVYAGNIAYGWKGTMPWNTNVVLKEGTVSIAVDAFFNSTLASISLPKSFKKLVGRTFYGCNYLKTITIDAENPYLCSLDNALYNKNKDTLYFVPVSTVGDFEIPSTVKTIYNAAMYGCKNITSIKIPSSVTVIGNDAFNSCDLLTSVTMSPNVTYLGNGAFCWCGKLSDITLPLNIKGIGENEFNGCKSLVSIIIPDAVDSIGQSAFIGCINLKDITLSSGLKKIGLQAFGGCIKLKSVTIPSKVISLPSNTPIFGACKNLENIYVDKNNTSFCDIDGVLFSKNSKELIEFPAHKTKHYVIPQGVVKLRGGAFSYCDSLISVDIPSSVNDFGNIYPRSQFEFCSALDTICCHWTKPVDIYDADFGDDIFCSYTEKYYNIPSVDKSKCILVVPDGSSSAYKSAKIWKDFAHIMEYSAITSITSPLSADEIIRVEYYSIDGMRLSSPQNNKLIIRRNIYKSGKVKTEKIIM